MSSLIQPWPWYITGPLIGLMVPLLLIFGNKMFGISASLRHFCAACIPSRLSYFTYDWRKEMWNIALVLGIVAGGFIGYRYMTYVGANGNTYFDKTGISQKPDSQNLVHYFDVSEKLPYAWPNITHEARILSSDWGLTTSLIDHAHPTEIFSWDKVLTLRGLLFMVLGGMLVGFGTRYANGCTGGHSIMGLSQLSPASLVATIGFFVGGLVSSWFIVPFFLKLFI